MALKIVVLGAGITGLTAALALHKYLPDPKPDIILLEVRAAPSTIGGAVNLTPKALRYLDHLGVSGAECRTVELYDLYTGTKISEVDLRGPDGKGIGKAGNQYFGRRVMRWQLQEALLNAVQAQDQTQIWYGTRITQIEETTEQIRLSLQAEMEITCDVLLGCDGIHSIARSMLVEPTRTPMYTGASLVMTTEKLRPGLQLKWDTTALITGRKGSFISSYYEPTKQHQFIAVTAEVADVKDRGGWKVHSNQGAIKDDMIVRFASEAMPEVAAMAKDAIDWSCYPVHVLSPGGKWTSPGGRCVLLGDAAHAMPPQGESTGLCIEDAVVFARALLHHKAHPLPLMFAAYERFRRPEIDAAVSEAAMRWEKVKDSGWLAYRMTSILTPWFLWWTRNARHEAFAQDYSDLDLDVDGSGLRKTPETWGEMLWQRTGGRLI